jgi:hypothetical protein
MSNSQNETQDTVALTYFFNLRRNAEKALANTFAWASANAARNQRFISVIATLGAGFLLGFAGAVGLGLTRPASFIAGTLIGLAVLAAGSLTGFLAIQTVLFASVALVNYVVLRVIPEITISAVIIQATYYSLPILGVIVSRIPRVHLAISSLKLLPVAQFFAALLFALLVRTIRIGRPSDANYALSQMYLAEDNAGVVAVLSQSLDRGFSSHASLFGEFINGIYVASAGLIQLFGGLEDRSLLSALTHWNTTTLFLAWMPLAAICAVMFSGIKLKTMPALIVLFIMSTIQILLFWPFLNLGHTSVISAGLVAMCLVSLTLNRRLVQNHPIALFVLGLSQGFIVATTWFPLMPLAAAIVGVIFISVIQDHLRDQNTRTLFVVILIFALAGLALLPEVFERIENNSSYLELPGGTRSLGEPLLLTWLAALGVLFWTQAKILNLRSLAGKPVFVIVVSVLALSTLFLFVTGFAANNSNPGYGALKYTLTVIAFSSPLLWLYLVSVREKFNYFKAISSGLVLIFLIVSFQYDSRAIASSFVITPQSPNTQVGQSGVFMALNEALGKNPDQIFCVSDYGIPVPGAELNMNSYSCTRWGQSLVGDENGQQWRFVPLGSMPEESLMEVLETYRDKRVVIVRFTDPGNPLLIRDTWWSKYVDESWEIVTVR